MDRKTSAAAPARCIAARWTWQPGSGRRNERCVNKARANGLCTGHQGATARFVGTPSRWHLEPLDQPRG